MSNTAVFTSINHQKTSLCSEVADTKTVDSVQWKKAVVFSVVKELNNLKTMDHVLYPVQIFNHTLLCNPLLSNLATSKCQTRRECLSSSILKFQSDFTWNFKKILSNHCRNK